MQGRYPKHLEIENLAKLWNNFECLAISYVYFTILFWFGAFLIKNDPFRFCCEKIVTSLVDILQCNLIHSYFLTNFLFVRGFSKFLRHILRHLE